MSYSLIPILIDLPKLRSAIGSKDQTLFEAIRNRDPERFDDNYYELPLGKAVRQLVMGEELDAGSPDTHQYGYALKELCEWFGTVLPFELWDSVHWAVIEATNVSAVLRQTGSPIDIPKNPEDFPVIGHLERGRIQGLVQQMGDEGLTHNEPGLQELLKEFEGWLRHASAENKDLVLFYH